MADPVTDRIQVGWVSRAHGLTGEVEVQLNWASSRSLAELSEVIVTSRDGVETIRQVEGVRRTPKGFLMCLQGVVGRTAAEALKGSTIGAPRSALPQLEPGEYYLRDLVGAEVIAPCGSVGKIVAVHVYPSVDSAEIELPTGEHVELPLLDEWVDSVDVEAAVLKLTTRDGLIESEQRKKS